MELPIRGKFAVLIIDKVLKLPGWFDYSGDASYQAACRLPNGKMLRVGITDDDVGTGNLWVDTYGGLNLK